MSFLKKLFGAETAKRGIAMFIFIAPALAQTFSASQDFSNTTVNNLTGSTIDAMDVMGKDGTMVAGLFIEGKSMTFGNDQRPIKGAGSIAGKGFSILILPQGKHAPGETQGNKVRSRQITVKEQGGMLTCCGGIPLASGEIRDLASGHVPQGSLLLKMGYISWNDDGSTRDVEHLQPTIACSNGKRVRITSALERPTVKDGLLFIDTELGKLSLSIKFGGYGTAEGPTDFLCTTDKKSSKGAKQ